MQDDALNIAEIPYPSGEVRYRYARYLSQDGSRWVRHGQFREYYQGGLVRSEGTYEHGKENGIWRDYHENGQLAAEGVYQQGVEVGTWMFWSDTGAPETGAVDR